MQDSFDLYEAALSEQFNLGCLSIQNAHRWKLSHFVWEGSASSVGATFFCDLKEPWDDTNLLRIEVYKLPAGASEFAEQQAWYTRGRKSRRIKISDGQLFDDQMLGIKAFGNDWTCDAFALSKGEIIRIYQTKKFAVIFRFLARSGTFLDHPIFKRLPRDIAFDAKCWEKKAPSITEKKRKAKIVDEPLSRQEVQELQGIIASTEKRLGITKSTTAARKLDLVEAEIARHRSKGKSAACNIDELAVELGAVVGACFCKAVKWEWRRIGFPGIDQVVCVCCPERRVIICPGAWIADLLRTKSRPLNCQLTFNMIAADRLPPTRPKTYTPLG